MIELVEQEIGFEQRNSFVSLERPPSGDDWDTALTGIPPIPLAPVRYGFVKRVFDIVVALAAMVLLSPLFLIIAIAIAITSPGPVIFRQWRMGEGGRPFLFYKFRSMCADAEQKRAGLMDKNEMTGPVFKIKKDPRTTPIGCFLRKYSMDELPQLYNVIRGDMSIVGPRPPIPDEVCQYGERERRRLAVKPGLTCLWQVSGRNNVQFDEWVELDLQYIRDMSFRGDLAIVARTVPAVLTARGAH